MTPLVSRPLWHVMQSCQWRRFKDAAALQQANAIRQYVDTLRTFQTKTALTSPEEFDSWTNWALAQADRIDPAIGGAFIDAVRDEEAS